MNGIEVVKIMQEYIRKRIYDSDFSIKNLCKYIGYSRRNADRLFKQYIGITLHEYVNCVYLTKSARELLKTSHNILDIALNNNYKSHEGFTRSFNKKFHITPAEYREKHIPVNLFVQYPINHYYAMIKYREEKTMDNNLKLCMITVKERPERKLIYLPSHNSTDYLSYCEEMGCQWEGFLNSIEEKYDTAALIDLPDYLVNEGFSKVAAGVEVTMEFDKPLPEQYITEVLPKCFMMYFQSEPYENSEDFCISIDSVYDAIKKYNPVLYGYKFAYDIAPVFNFGAEPEIGARVAVPVLCNDK